MVWRVMLLLTAISMSSPALAGEGYTDTPMIPGQSWRVHDANRPVPPVVAPGKETGAPPSDAIVLFAGKDLSEWRGVLCPDKKGKYNPRGEAIWKLEDDYMECNNTGDLISKRRFGSCQLHLEFACPKPARGTSQGRGNSGIFLMNQYEIQILDSYENVTYADGQAASVYGQYPPMVNVCRPPGEWQSLDIVFIAPRFRDGEVVEKSRVTVLHNGVLAHHNREILGATTHKRAPSYKPHPDKLPFGIQDHGNPIRFRNIWVRELD